MKKIEVKKLKKISGGGGYCAPQGPSCGGGYGIGVGVGVGVSVGKSSHC